MSGDRTRSWTVGRWLGLAVAGALLGAAGSIVGLWPGAGIYRRETTELADAAAAQDLVNLVVVAPLLIVLGRRARDGQLRAYLVWLGCLAFTVYNYAIYAFSIHFGPLFLVWVGVLGLSAFALLGSLATAEVTEIRGRFAGREPRAAGWFLIAAAVLFAIVWLSEIVPDLLAGGPSRSADLWNVPTNPVYVLDLAFFLPAAAASGVLLLRRHRWGYVTAVGQLTLLALTCLPILVTPIVAALRDHHPGWAIIAPIGLLLLGDLTALGTLLRQIPSERPRRHPPELADRLTRPAVLRAP